MILKHFSPIISVIAAASMFFIAVESMYGQGGGTYTAFGIGDIERSNSSAFDGAGGTAVTQRSRYALNPINPAAWADLKYTTVQTGFIFRQHSNSDGFMQTSQFNGNLQGINIAFAVDTTDGIAIAMGLRPYSSVHFESRRRQSLFIDNREIIATTEYLGSGGVSQAFIGGSFKPIEGLSVGASVLYNFGRIRTSYNTTFDDFNFTPARTEISEQLGGVGAQAGIIFEPTEDISIGAAVRTPSSISVTRRERFQRIAVSDTITTSESSFSMPLTLTLGGSIALGGLIYAIEAETADYSTMEFRQGEHGAFGQAMRLALGVSRPLSSNPDADFWDKAALHAGVGFQQHYYTPNGNTVNEIFGTFGIQTPVAISSYVDAAAVAGIRGNTSPGMIRELFVRLSFSVTVGETWFIPFYRD